MRSFIISLSLLAMIGCQSSQKKESVDIDRQIIHVPENALENYYYVDRAKNENAYKKMVVDMYTTKKLYAGWRPEKWVDREDDTQVKFDGTFVKFMAGKDQILSQEITTELELDRFNEELYFKNQSLGQELNNDRNRQGYTIPYKRVTKNQQK
jgi:hypothetical protein